MLTSLISTKIENHNFVAQSARQDVMKTKTRAKQTQRQDFLKIYRLLNVKEFFVVSKIKKWPLELEKISAATKYDAKHNLQT